MERDGRRSPRSGRPVVSPLLPNRKFGRRFRPHFRRRKKKLFRPGVLSRVWCLGPCGDLRGCEAVRRSRFGHSEVATTHRGRDKPGRIRRHDVPVVHHSHANFPSPWLSTAGQHPERRVDWQHRYPSNLSRNDVRAHGLFLGQNFDCYCYCFYGRRPTNDQRESTAVPYRACRLEAVKYCQIHHWRALARRCLPS
jgi:hypothetical protein